MRRLAMAAKEFLSTPSIVLFTLALVAVTLIAAERNKQGPADADSRAELTLKGLFNYFWKHDPKHKDIEFLFSCGTIGEIGTSRISQCSCYDLSSCVNCFRWFTGIAVESVATYGIHMNTTNHSSLPDVVYNHSPYNANWDGIAQCTYIDDFLWYGIAYLRVYEWLSDEKWLNRSIAVYDWAWKYGWDEPCGGFYWCTCGAWNIKFNIQFLEAMHLASKLAYTLPNETRFLKDAVRLWNWFFSYDNGYGLMSEEYLVSTGAIPQSCCNASSSRNPCYNSKTSGASYNQGLLLSSAAYLYLSTGNKTFLNVGLRACEAIMENYTKNGVLIDEPRGFPTYTGTCSLGSDPGGDWYSFNGIFMLHLGYFTELLVKNGSMPTDTLKNINSFVQATSDSAWSKSAVWPPFNTTDDVCKPGSAPLIKNASYPKFNWWWRENVDVDNVTPSDPGYYYHKSQLRCVTINGNDTQIWEGQVESEDKCVQKCERNVNCSKYLWQVYEDAVPGTNCWIWSYNRSNHICNQSDSDWNVGVKRQKGNATCAGKCGSSEPQKLSHGVCYCDSNCAKHLDCCRDYTDQCHPKEPSSCKGLCNKVQAVPLLGGGYCWCFAGCNYGYTGGSCCSDYLKLCQSEYTMATCLDGRTQGSALNLFLSHAMISKSSKLLAVSSA